MGKLLKVFCIVNCISVIFCSGEKKSYDGFKVIELGDMKSFKSEDDFYLKLNLPLENDLDILDTNSREGTAQVLVSPTILETFLGGVRNLQLPHKVVIDNMGWLIQKTEISRGDMQDLKGEPTFDRYMDFTEITAYLETLSKKQPNKVKLSSIGQSFEGKDIHMVTISDTTEPQRTEKPIIFIEAGLHAREWISPASALYMIKNLTESSPSSLGSGFEWRIVPVGNPDGYHHTWTKNRLWRKNRRTIENTHCHGVDLNRNFDSHWLEVGSSNRPCSDIYAGTYAFSEPETESIRRIFSDQNLTKRVKAYVSIHSYGQFILLPPAHGLEHVTVECEQLLGSIGRKMAQKIFDINEVSYTVGAPPDVLYPAAGSSMDWALMNKKIPLSFTYEMRDKGGTGFLLPDAQISTAVEDFWLGMFVLTQEITKYRNSGTGGDHSSIGCSLRNK